MYNFFLRNVYRLHYYALLNTLQYKRKSSLLEPLIGLMHAQKAFFEMGHEITSKTEFDDFVSNIGVSVQG
jgi:DCC-interacting protein 13 alpha